MATRCLKLEYLGIVLTISATCISSTYFGLYDESHLQVIYISWTIVACAAAVFSAVLDPDTDGPKAANWR